MKIYKDNQEVFDIVWHKFVVMKQAKSMNDDECVYTHPGCFIGCLLTARDAKMLDNHRSGESIMSINAILFAPEYERQKEKVKVFQRVRLQFQNCNHYFLTALQHVHDTFEPKTWREVLIDLAKTYGLTVQLDLEV